MRLSAEHRRRQIVEAARKLSYEGRLYDWSLEDVANAVGVTRPAVRHYFYSAQSLRNEVIRKAIKERDVNICVQALAKYDPLADGIGPALRRKCAEHIAA